jgi:glycosyltransferase involved in cell wall biosynthesis
MVLMRKATKRICVVLVVDDLGYGGAERQVVELANNLNDNCFDVHVCALSNHVPLRGTLTDADRRLHIVNKVNRFDFTVVPRLSRLLQRLEADIVHGYLFAADIAGRLAGRIAGTQVVIGSERNANRPIGRLHRIALKYTLRHTDCIVANSDAGAKSNQEVFGFPSSDYRIVHNGVDTSRFKPTDGTSMRRELGLASNCPTIGAFANFKKQKNHAMLFRAFRQLLDSVPDARLVLVGDRPVDIEAKLNGYQAQIERLLDSLQIRHRCLFLGHRHDIERLYPACDVTALSSLHEGTPNVLLESMACGVSVIATSVCDNERIVREGEVGYLVEVGDDAGMANRMELLLSDAVRRKEMGKKARAWVLEEFSTKRLAEKMESVYMELLGTAQS